jgi:hypothetical protein
MEKATQLQGISFDVVHPSWPYSNIRGECPADVLKELVLSHDDDKLSTLSDKALQLLDACTVLDYSQKEQKNVAFQLHTSGVALWNKSVALKSATAISSPLNAQRT